MEYASKDLVARFGITGETLRQWTHEFKRHLSEGANPGGGQHRRFTFEDLEVLTLVAEMRQKKHAWEDIHASLDMGERGVPSIDPAALIPLESQQQLALLHQTIERLREQVNDLKTQLNTTTTRADRAEGAQDSLRQQIEEARETIIQLRIRLHTLEGKGS
jgi:DNA-binding transcriptional MerR regulator